ncbi:transporter [uncultured Alistipes sp.]|uniref:OmpP1/FadL family transporter n=1 Tax=uncultured Alistipes sp. TaxID=538949 RepID=UPI00261CB902|nr:transporter [uncultured Alistipes sp.]
MKRLRITLAAVALIACGTTLGQNLSFGGAVLNRDGVMAGEFAQLSQTQPFGTARSMALGGAFASLGADLASMSVNPAGLGMYQRNEIVLTPMMTFQSSDTAGTNPFGKNGKNRFAMANFGAALNTYQSSGTLTSLTIGIGLNRIADFNSRYSYKFDTPYPNGGGQAPSIADVFGRQLGQAGIFPNNNGELGYDYNNPYFWPAILGYNGYMISSFTDAAGSYYVPDCIGSNASILHYMDVVNSGSINEFALSFGANFNNIVYLGATIGIQSVHKSTGIYYGEDYRYDNGPAANSAGDQLISQLDYADLYQHSVLDGSGANLKIGVIVRPSEALRIGVAFHTPTYYSLERSYYGTINSQLYNNDTGDTEINSDGTPYQDDMGSDSWCFTSPARLMLGISYTFGNFGLISIDYERDWYNGIRVKNTPDGFDIYPEDYKAEFKHGFQGTNTLRAGIEIKPLPVMALRVGGGFTGSMFKNRNDYYDMPLAYRTSYVAAGIGFNLSRSISLDMAYQYIADKQTPYQLFYSLDRDTGTYYDSTGLFDTQSTRHNAVLSLAFHF